MNLEKWFYYGLNIWANDHQDTVDMFLF